MDYTAEEFLGEGDAITMTFTPYLQGNMEAVSVVLAGGTDVRLDLADKNAIACEGDAMMAAWTEIIPKNNRNDAEFGKFSTKQLFFWKVLLILHRKTKIYGKDTSSRS